jgi:hypothetical protein
MAGKNISIIFFKMPRTDSNEIPDRYELHIVGSVAFTSDSPKSHWIAPCVHFIDCCR